MTYIMESMGWIFLLLQIIICKAGNREDYDKLTNHIFENYGSERRPVLNEMDVVDVKVKFNLISINDLEEIGQTLITYGYIGLFWRDNYLSWNFTDYDIEYLVIRQDKIWKPDVVVGNSVEQTTALGYGEQLLRVNAKGSVTWYPTMVFSSACDVNIRYYPFDTQTCIIQLETSTYQNSEITFTIEEDTVDLSEFSPNGEWDLISTAIRKGNSSYKDMVNIQLTLKRRSRFFILNIILPIILLSLMGSLVFVLPADSGEKMSLAVTILLAYVVFLTLISDSMPQTSLQISVLAVYLSVLVAMSTSSVVFTTVVLHFYHKNMALSVPKFGVLMVKLIRCGKKSNSNNVGVSPGGDRVVKQYSEEDTEEVDKVTWQDVSAALDTILFFISMFFTLVTSIVCLVMLFEG